VVRPRSASRSRAPTLKGVKFEGPFFESDPAKVFADNVQDFMQRVADAGEADVRARLSAYPRKTHGRRTEGRDPVQSYIEGRVRSLGGKRWRKTAVVSPVPRSLGRAGVISLRAATAYIERNRHPFRSTRTAIRRVTRDAARALLRGL
jgi:hypothetical protein